MMNEISIRLKFKEYEFRRVKTMGNTPVVYTTMDWVGKTALLIPMPMTVTDRWIERHKDADDGTYDITIKSDTILKKVVKESTNVGRVYVPKDWIGLDVLVIEAPILDDF